MFNTLVNIHTKIQENGNFKNSKKNVAVINFIYLTVTLQRAMIIGGQK